ncbi:MAG: cupin [Gammaproteobacteria bacterium]|jgi:hypothetical protein|nr:cupin [Gammaproteobacteria bacterium]
MTAGHIIDLGILENRSLDKYWIQESENLWFKPVRLDAVHGYYTCYWYANQNCSGGYHYHSGATHGINLNGSMVFTDIHDKVITAKPDQYFYIPPGVTHKADIIVDNENFLFYGSIEGSIIYLDDHKQAQSKLDVFDYIKLAVEHYQRNKLNIANLSQIIVQ